MKAITICQPYPRLILIGVKHVENRSWYTAYRGPLLIHAGKSRQWLGVDDEQQARSASDPLLFGAIVGYCSLAACVKVQDIEAGKHDHRFPQLIGRAHCYGPWCWVLENIHRLETPISCNGKQGLWNFPDSDLPELSL